MLEWEPQWLGLKSSGDLEASQEEQMEWRCSGGESLEYLRKARRPMRLKHGQVGGEEQNMEEVGWGWAIQGLTGEGLDMTPSWELHSLLWRTDRREKQGDCWLLQATRWEKMLLCPRGKSGGEERITDVRCPWKLESPGLLMNQCWGRRAKRRIKADLGVLAWRKCGMGYHSQALASTHPATTVTLVTNKIHFNNTTCCKKQIYNAVILTLLFRCMFVVGAHQICESMLFPLTWK